MSIAPVRQGVKIGYAKESDLMSNFWSGFAIGSMMNQGNNRGGCAGCASIIGLLVVIIAVIAGMEQCSHQQAVHNATDERLALPQLLHPALTEREAKEMLAAYPAGGQCDLSLLPVSIPPPADGQPVVNVQRVETDAMKSVTLVRQYDTASDQFRRVVLHVNYVRDGQRIVGTITAALSFNETMTQVPDGHGGFKYHKVQSWGCEKATFKP